ncbi:hypothetical protein SEA_BOLT007_5 [Arthrobacter phage Bolt007]|uniref:Uncharacterized protein n=1 Tax=Arthrobacter phage Bolt007 TaxID=3017297 RepID=A0AA49I818_9CAUD|nr:hypothetical protein SEA_BOLT007_5 [Arthrobacter phage Bolt007]
MISLHDARLAAAASGAPLFAAEGLRGTYAVSPDAYETPDVYVIVDGAREAVIDGLDEYHPMDKPLTVVVKATGEVLYVPVLESGDLLDVATDVHDPDPTPIP